jgi:hypothetical protein
MSEKRKRQAQVLCTDEVWSRFQALATERGKTIPVLLGEIVETETALKKSNEQTTLPDADDNKRPEVAPRLIPAPTLIGFGQPVVRIR